MTTQRHERRGFFAREVVQTSSMDCGPAALRCLASAFGLELDYAHLREACRTDVDGTSIDTLEQIGRSLGLDLEQVLVPLDHLLLSRTPVWPAIVVTRQAGGAPHFLVAWARAGAWIQLMDPVSGRRWTRSRQFLDEVYPYSTRVSATAWRRWADMPEYRVALDERLRELGFRASEAEQLVSRAASDPAWRALAALDAATRMARSLVDSRAVRRGGEATRLHAALLAGATEGAPGAPASRVPPTFWPAVEPDGEPGTLLVRGAVVLRMRPGSPAPAQGAPGALPPELAAARDATPLSPLRALARRCARTDAGLLVALGFAIVTAAGATVLEAVLLRGLLRVQAGSARGATAFAPVLALVAFVVLLEIPARLGLATVGRGLELGLRRALREKLPRMASRYLRSRPVSDLGERAHSLHLMRSLPALAGQMLRVALHLLFTAAGLVWLDPAGAPWVVAMVATGVLLPLASQRVLSERELRARTHGGGLSRFYLDALTGIVPARTHGAERSLRAGHGELLARWRSAGEQCLNAVLAQQALQAVAGLALCLAMLGHWLAAGREPSGALLLLYWALSLPALGEEFAHLLALAPLQRNVALRLLEPLDALEEEAFLGAGEDRSDAAPHADEASAGMSLSFADVSVTLGQREVLGGVNLEIAPGEHVGIVGSSGAGKSSLVGCLLGWNRAQRGRISADGRALDAETVRRLRRQTAWADETVRLWNLPLEANLRFGNGDVTSEAFERALDDAELRDVLARRPAGLATIAGEAGALFSGGEGQRLRLARALLREGVRLVLLDEPFRGLGREQRSRILARARARWNRATLLYVTHDVAETLAFDRVLVLEAGRVIEEGPPAALASREGSRYRALLARERDVNERLWGAHAWRRWRLERGRLAQEDPA